MDGEIKGSRYILTKTIEEIFNADEWNKMHIKEILDMVTNWSHVDTSVVEKELGE